MQIKLPNLQEQKRIVGVKAGIEEAAGAIMGNLTAPDLPGQSEIDEGQYSAAHLLTEGDGWEPPHQDIVGAYFRHFQSIFTEYGSDAKLANLLGLSSDRRIREYKQGVTKVPYGVWRRFLVMTGRASQEIIYVFGYFGAAAEMPKKRYEINENTLGFRITFYELGVQPYGVTFPIDLENPNKESAKNDAYNAAFEEGESWLSGA